MKGTYILILGLDRSLDIAVGKLGTFHLRPGYYYYIGSALGTGGFKRVQRHFNVASGKNYTRQWHIDYLLPHSRTILAVLLPTNEAIECKVAGTIIGSMELIPGFGCSDCTCKSHLFFGEKDVKNKIVRRARKMLAINESIIIHPGM